MAHWVEMWMICFALFGAAKALTLVGLRGAATNRRLGAYLCLWPGMDARRFLGPTGSHATDAAEWRAALLRGATGLGLVFAGVRFAHAISETAAAWLGIAGGVLILHFGAFDLISLAWRSRGVDAPPLMDAPHRAVSVAEFWNRRWNRAFHQLVIRFVFTPLARRLGPLRAMGVGFAVSGLIHELAISVPARGGLGLPTAYFLIQGLGVALERTKPLRSCGAPGWMRHAGTLLWVAGPSPLLFHPPFLRNVMLGFLHALRAY